jgi:GNAT superfamily N-acetyltransferase
MPDGEGLESGYGASTATGDNLCNDFQQETARSYLDLARSRGDRTSRIAGTITMTDAATPLPFWNRAVLEQPMHDPGDVLGALADFYGASGPMILLDSAWPTPDLRAQGFTLMGHPPLMVRQPDTPLPPAPAELGIVRVTDASGAADLEHTLVDGYPAPQLQPFRGVKLMTDGALNALGWHHFVGYVDDRPVAAGSSYVGDRLLRVENIATLPDVRGRGYGVAITAAAIAAAPEKTATLVASDLGRPIYERLGFVAMLRVTYWVAARDALAR